MPLSCFEKLPHYKKMISDYQRHLGASGGGMMFFVQGWLHTQSTIEQAINGQNTQVVTSLNQNAEYRRHKEIGSVISHVNALIEQDTNQEDFLEAWSKAPAFRKKELLQFSPQSYLSIRKKVSLDTLSFNAIGQIKEPNVFTKWHYLPLYKLTKSIFNIMFLETLTDVQKLILKKKLEEKVEALFPHFKSSPQNTLENIYLNLLNLSILKVINTLEENNKLTDFSLLGEISYPQALTLHNCLEAIELYDPAGIVLSSDIFSISFFLRQEEEIKDELNEYLKIKLEKKTLEDSIAPEPQANLSTSSANITPNSNLTKI